MPKLSKADELLRESQVLRVQALRLSDPTLSIIEACRQVGIEERTYQRWVQRVSVDALQQEISKQRAKIAQKIVEARQDGLDKVIDIATGKDQTARAADVLAANRDLKEMYDDLVDQIESAGQEDKEAAAYLEGTPPWLQGPATITIRATDGTTVTVQTPQRPAVVEGSVVAQDTSALPPPAEVQQSSDSQDQV